MIRRAAGFFSPALAPVEEGPRRRRFSGALGQLVVLVEPDPDYVFADRIGARYGGADLRQNDGPGDSRVVVSFPPVKVNTFG